MGKHLNRAKLYFGTDTRGLLDGGRYALLHTRSLEFDDLRPYVAGDDIRDIDWKASARSGSVLIKRYVSEKHHKILLIADTGRNMTALAPSGEVKRDVALHVIGAIGLITLGRSDELGMVYGDSRGSANIRARRGETHIESLLQRFYTHTCSQPATSDIVTQLTYVATGYRRRMLIIVISDEPDADRRLAVALQQLSGRHDLMWAMVSDMPAVGSAEGERDGYDVATGGYVLNGATLGPRIIDAYRRREAARIAELDEFLTTQGVQSTRIGGSAEIRAKIVALTEAFQHAG
ncbi:DUF58 domain-containing protein [Mycobacterium kansasii]|uniref:DUF58 domain-containing protein n=4 Tax=Mycobacterium kansasii TaxID=1768 RepID=A0A653EHT2_MYCKA|nr:DUF58 domain-containing protein [Mycobacterium kansasii]EUA01711.1 hypothetical protein I547_4272 [Mycobacterium kansasii 824]AGZ49751.1 hypothetical protein MKAN_05230 [Mycobacterium kansasii ATCC 12478]ARG58345.1 hypothetical protein B1T43_23775 [Mycobacterium kansasii]ARG63860.1 hypothetical protein B1T45_24330 [Mycobacterium kansasii]ARG71504.1 hypothetical protein B1T47_23665 [Mycobacterium kansasii]